MAVLRPYRARALEPIDSERLKQTANLKTMQICLQYASPMICLVKSYVRSKSYVKFRVKTRTCVVQIDLNGFCQAHLFVQTRSLQYKSRASAMMIFGSRELCLYHCCCFNLLLIQICLHCADPDRSGWRVIVSDVFSTPNPHCSTAAAAAAAIQRRY